MNSIDPSTPPFIDAYVDGSWLHKLGEGDFNNNQAHVTLPEAERIRIVSYISFYGWFTRELFRRNETIMWHTLDSIRVIFFIRE